jgi:hypothetical protein
MDGNGRAVTRRVGGVLEVGLCLLDGRQARAVHGSEHELVTNADGLFAGALVDMSSRVEVELVSVLGNSLASNGAIGGVVDFDHKVRVGQKTTGGVGDKRASNRRPTVNSGGQEDSGELGDV